MFARAFVVACGFIVCMCLPAIPTARPDQAKPETPADPVKQRLHDLDESLTFAQESLSKGSDDLMIFHRLEDLAIVDKSRFTGPPPRVIKNKTAQGAGNRTILSAYTFVPKKALTNAKRPLIVLVHGGVHGNFDTSYIHTVRELVAQGYAVLAPEYRGSSGYGKDLWQLIDYGGREIEDVFAAKQWMLETHDDIDPARVGIIGWSHGGLIALMNLFEHPKDYKVGYAGVPVCDLVARMGYKGQDYRDLFSASYHIGKTAEEDVNEYRRRSPAWNAEKLQTPLLIHTTTNDEDVNVLEVEHLIKALKAADKKFEHKIYKDAPGGHEFNRIDTKLAKESRAEMHRFLAKYLNPPNGPK
jgi:dipeptidyl aminopeptidase/acylaminoacyl peptidase